MKRIAGFYWVKLDGEWMVAYWADSETHDWLIIGSEFPRLDTDFEEIFETQIIEEH